MLVQDNVFPKQKQHESFKLELDSRNEEVISRPGQSQGLLYKHLRD